MSEYYRGTGIDQKTCCHSFQFMTNGKCVCVYCGYESGVWETITDSSSGEPYPKFRWEDE